MEDSITIAARAPQEAVKDKEGMIWVLSGIVAKGKAAALTRINPVTRQVIKTYQFEAPADPIHLVFNEGRDTLYFIEVNYDGGTQHNGI